MFRNEAARRIFFASVSLATLAATIYAMAAPFDAPH
jgi:hypothetical protein